jgi:cyanobactin cluster PatC/TenC/TruC protein
VRVPSAYPLDTGLVDYGMWVEIITRNPPPEPPPDSYRRGRIWA